MADEVMDRRDNDSARAGLGPVLEPVYESEHEHEHGAAVGPRD